MTNGSWVFVSVVLVAVIFMIPSVAAEENHELPEDEETQVVLVEEGTEIDLQRLEEVLYRPAFHVNTCAHLPEGNVKTICNGALDIFDTSLSVIVCVLIDKPPINWDECLIEEAPDVPGLGGTRIIEEVAI